MIQWLDSVTVLCGLYEKQQKTNAVSPDIFSAIYLVYKYLVGELSHSSGTYINSIHSNGSAVRDQKIYSQMFT